ncbi:hypothetical protein CCGE531_09090 [Rhizobium sp. CCGE531]|nr:hypothetical protein CCGE531_09090 [Rhizobium sp. CCGE531]
MLGAVIYGALLATGAISQVAASHLAEEAEKRAVAAEMAVGEEGSTPKEWPLRVFLSTSAVSKYASTLKGAKVVFPVGKNDGTGHVDGYVEASIVDVSLVPDDARLRLRLVTDVSYLADKENPWWASATAKATIEALALPQGAAADENGKHGTRFQIIPDSIRVQVGWFDWGAKEVAARLVANLTTIGLGDQLSFLIDPLPFNPEVDLSKPSISEKGLGGGGSTQIATTIHRDPVSLGAKIDQWLITRSGVWLLGGKPPATPVANLPGSLDAQRALLAGKLGPFVTSDTELVVAIDKSVIVGFAEKILGDAIEVSAATQNTNGNITNAQLKDDTLGTYGVVARPTADPFGTVLAVVKKRQVAWTKDGLSIDADVTAKADVKVNVHFDTGIGGGIGKDVDLHADAEAPLHATGKLQEVTVGAVKAVTFQPVLDCAPLTLELQGAPDTAITDIYFQTSPAHLQVVNAIGGGALAPALLVSDLPEILPTGDRIAADGSIVEKDPDRTIVVFPSKYLSVSFSTQGSATSEDGVTVKANVSVTRRDDPPTQKDTDSARKLRADLKDAVPKLECSKEVKVTLDVGGIRVLDIMRVAAAVQRELKAQQQIAEHVWKGLQPPIRGLPPRT